jgi:hypothetical protein
VRLLASGRENGERFIVALRNSVEKQRQAH